MSCKSDKKTIHIKSFNYVFEQHPESAFVGRKQIVKEIDSFLNAKHVKSPFLIIQGASGMGKTALMTNYIRPKRKEIVHYFIKYGVLGLTEALPFVNHLYYALSALYKLEVDNTIESIFDKTELLIDRFEEISKKCKKSDTTQAIFIDALDESIIERDSPRAETIVKVLNTLPFIENIRIVITSSRKLLELQVHSSASKPRVLLMKDDLKESLSDVEEYFGKNTLLKHLSEEDIHKLAMRSEGNFQYAAYVAEMLKADEVSIEWLLKNPPKGLFSLYSNKLSQIQEKVEKCTFENIWQVMELITLLSGAPVAPILICDILESKLSLYNEVFKNIETFFDQSLYKGENKKCRWFHGTFYNYVHRHLSNRDWKRISGIISIFVERMIASGHIKEVPVYLVENWDFYLLSSDRDLHSIPIFVRYTFIREFVKLADCSILEVPNLVLESCADRSIENGQFNDALFFYFIRFAQKYHTIGKDKWSLSSPYCTALMEGKTMLELKQQIGGETLTRTSVLIWRGIDLGAVRKMLGCSSDPQSTAQAAFKHMSCGPQEMWEAYFLLEDVFTEIVDQLQNVSDIYSVCNQYANDWFPPNETTSIDTQLSTSTTSKTHETDPEEIVSKIYTMLENSSFVSRKTLSEIEDIHRKRDQLSINVYINDTQGINFYKSLGDINKTKDQPVKAGNTYIYWTFLILFLNLGSRLHYTELSLALSLLKKGKEQTLRELELPQPALKDLRETQYSTINKSVSRIKKEMAEILGKKITNTFIDAESREVIYVRSFQETSLKTLLIMHKSDYEKIIKAIEFGKSRYRSSF